MMNSAWLRFLRHYGPVSRNDNMYDETIQRSARKLGIAPIEFQHPYQERVLDSFNQATADPVSVILTGTAGDGKTHLCRQVWKALHGNEDDWLSDSAYLTITFHYPKDRKTWPDDDNNPNLFRQVQIHFIRDLSGWARQQGAEWKPERAALLQKFCRSLFDLNADELFLIAANDGQLIETFRSLPEVEEAQRALAVIEEMLVEDWHEKDGIRLKLFNLSQANSAELFDLTLEKFLSHPGWNEDKQLIARENDVFGPKCPVRKNYELLCTPLVQARLRSLLELCDHNGLHVPIRQILLLLANAVLGHPDAKDHLMVPEDVPKIIAADTVSKASLYNNIFGGNLSEVRRQSITIFDYLERFQVGYETSNRIDNILIFGQDDSHLGSYFQEFIAADSFYGANDRFYAAKNEYIEGTNEEEEKAKSFLEMLVSQRRGLFFKIPTDAEAELKLWELTVFKFAGEYLNEVANVLKSAGAVKRLILARLVKGLNRVFTGMLINSDRELFLATSGNYSQAKVSRILIERVSVDPSKGEKIALRLDPSNGHILLSVFFTPELFEDFDLTLIRYEFLSRIALEGALPASFSKECYEDLLSFKSKLIACFMRRHSAEAPTHSAAINLKLLSLTEQGMPDPKFVEVTP
jgi:hypothetical protein